MSEKKKTNSLKIIIRTHVSHVHFRTRQINRGTIRSEKIAHTDRTTTNFGQWAGVYPFLFPNSKKLPFNKVFFFFIKLNKSYARRGILLFRGRRKILVTCEK